jgi:threonine synthase
MSEERHSAFNALRCVTCDRAFDPDEVLYTCPDCGPLLGTLDVLYDIPWLRARINPGKLAARRDATLWRYHELLPIRKPEAIVPIPVGMTPLYEFPGEMADGKGPPGRLWIKDDTRHPSGSAKDRATAVGLARARELGLTTVAAASTGNAASSLATLAAPAGADCFIFAPATAPLAKLIQIRIHGAHLVAVQGTYDDAFDLCMSLCERSRLYNRSTAVNPVLGEGKKTIALEIWEQLGYRAPDVVLVPVGDGCILGGVAKGFQDLLDLGLIERVPPLVGVQAEGSRALAEAWRQGKDRCEPVVASTLADSISVAEPRDQIKALRAVRNSQGGFVTVSDEAILEAMSSLASRVGIFVEPAAAAAYAGLHKALAEETVRGDEETVLVFTGHGLKDIDAAQKAAAGNQPIQVEPGPEAVEDLIRVVEKACKRSATQS